MKLLLVRHAAAIPRREWKGEAALRPLTDVGVRQAEALADFLRHETIDRITSSPDLHCQQTLEPLVVSTSCTIELDERLNREEEVQRVLELLPAFGEECVVLCTHRDVIAALLRVFELEPRDDEREGTPCRKGSVWILEGPGYTPTTARYLEPVGERGSRKRGRLRFDPAQPESRRAAVLDLGSTSFHLLIADVTPNASIRPVVREKVMLRLGAVIAEHGTIPPEAADRAVAVARELREIAEREKVERLFPVGTAALRDAENGAELAERIGRTLGPPVRVLSGEEEARLIYRAFRERLSLGADRILALDLGGGSLEIAAGSRDEIEYETTLALGVARLHRAMVQHDPMRDAEEQAVRACVREALAPHLDALRTPGFERCVGTGGTLRALGRILDAERSRRNEATGERVARTPGRLTRKRVAKLCRELVPSTHEERLAMRGMSRERADLLATGAVIVHETLRALDATRLELCDWGLREGVLLDAFA